jgi:glycosyltransferase involved in cell wall biosynthesis
MPKIANDDKPTIPESRHDAHLAGKEADLAEPQSSLEKRGRAPAQTEQRENEVIGGDDEFVRSEASPRLAEQVRGAGPQVSVIIPVYDGSEHLAECLESVLNQTWHDYEVIVVDDGSTDSSLSICQRYPGVRIIQQENRGQSAARNRGVREAKGEYIAFLDQDDRWYPERLATQIPILKRNDKYGMVYSNVDRIDEKGNMVERNFLDGVSLQPKRTIMDCLAADMFILPGSVLIRKSIFDELGGFDERLSGYEDDDLFLRTFQRSRIFYIRDALIQWRIYPTSYSYTDRMERSRRIYIKKLMEAFPNSPEANTYYTRDLIAARFMNTYLFLYFQSLRFVKWQGQPQQFRSQIASLLPHQRRRSVALFMIAHLPVPIARQLRKVWRRLPGLGQRLIRQRLLNR